MEFFTHHIYALFWVFAVLCMLLFYIRHKKRIRAFLLGGSAGLLSLVLLHFFGERIGHAPHFSAANLLLSVLLGVPGTLLTMAAHFWG